MGKGEYLGLILAPFVVGMAVEDFFSALLGLEFDAIIFVLGIINIGVAVFWYKMLNKRFNTVRWFWYEQGFEHASKAMNEVHRKL